MRTLYESLLDDEDVLVKNSDDILQLEELKQWLYKRAKEEGWFNINKISLVNGKISWKDGTLSLAEKYEDMPNDIYFGEVDELWLVHDEPTKKHIHQFDKCRMRDLYVHVNVENLELTLASAYFFSTVKKIKNVEFHLIPPVGLSRLCNKICLSRLEFIKELKFDNGNNVIVAGDSEEFGEDVVKYVKKGISKKRSKTPFQTMYQLEQSIMELVYEILPMDYIEKNWEGIKRIVFSDRDGVWRNGSRMDVIKNSDLKPGDFMIEKRNGEWVPIQRLFNKL